MESITSKLVETEKLRKKINSKGGKTQKRWNKLKGQNKME